MLETALHAAASEGHLPVAQALVIERADINTQDTPGRTPLAYAQGLGDREFGALFLQHGAEWKKRGRALPLRGRITK
jgi:ankyrin repeat protein